MVFEEFFKKKKINLSLLQNSEPSLFAEFKTHYTQMGEKSFDHTKKYWFNQLRRKYPAPIEVKVEKVVIENRLAEQTIADTLSEPANPSPATGFKPRFKPAMINKPAEDTAKTEDAPAPVEEKPVEDTPKPVGFKPRFKAGMVSKADEESAKSEETPAPIDENPVDEAPKPAGFKPRFKASMVSKPVEDTAKSEETPAPVEEKPADEIPKPVGFKPRFKASMVTKPMEEVKSEEEQVPPVEEKTEEASKPMGFKPRFKPKE